MTLDEFAESIPNFSSRAAPGLVILFAWYLHSEQKQTYIKARELTSCFDKLTLSPPSNIHSLLDRLTDSKIFLKDRHGYRLARPQQDACAREYGQQREATAKVEKLLTDLPSRLQNLQERSYLDEALICFRYKAFRAAVVMTWNLAYDHLCNWILADQKRLDAFNLQMGKTYAKKAYPAIVNRDSFEEPKEFEVIQVLASAGLITGGIHTVLKEKLDRRNKAAHPTGLEVNQLVAEGVISDLIENVVLKLN